MSNLFSILGIETKEIFHSKFLAFLLAPNGKFKSGSSDKDFFACEHEYGTKFLELFLKQIDAKNKKRKFNNTEVIIEADAGEYGRIDILLKISEDYWIAIENKIYAGDREKQLQRYRKYLEDKVDNYKLIYLTLDGRAASDSSIEDDDYIRISYKDDIIKWLDQCTKGKRKTNPIKGLIQDYQATLYKLVEWYEVADTIINRQDYNNRDVSSDILNKYVYPRIITEVIGDAPIFDSKEEFYPDGNFFYIWIKGKSIEYDLCFNLVNGVVQYFPLVIQHLKDGKEVWKIGNAGKWINWKDRRSWKEEYSISEFCRRVRENDETLKNDIKEMKEFIINNPYKN